MKAQVSGCLEALDYGADISPGFSADLRARFRFDPGLPVFAGHFPGRPLVPAVFLVEATRLACEGALGFPLCFGVKKAKFTSEVGPGDVVELEGDLVSVTAGETPTWECRAELRTHKGGAARIVLRLRKEGS